MALPSCDNLHAIKVRQNLSFAEKNIAPVGNNNKGLSINDVHSQGEGRFVQCAHFADKMRGGQFYMDVFYGRSLTYFKHFYWH